MQGAWSVDGGADQPSGMAAAKAGRQVHEAFGQVNAVRAHPRGQTRVCADQQHLFSLARDAPQVAGDGKGVWRAEAPINNRRARREPGGDRGGVWRPRGVGQKPEAGRPCSGNACAPPTTA